MDELGLPLNEITYRQVVIKLLIEIQLKNMAIESILLPLRCHLTGENVEALEKQLLEDFEHNKYELMKQLIALYGNIDIQGFFEKK